jgi:hypothetical protein
VSRLPRKDSQAEGVRKLRDIQRAFFTGVSRPLNADLRMQAQWVDGTSAEKAVGEFIKPNDRLTSFDRLEIYNKQYWFRLLDCLYEDFPALRSLLGDDRFHDMSVAYLTKYPSKTYALGELGYRLDKFLIEEPKWTKEYAVLARDLVRLEWAHIVAFDADALPPLEIDALLDAGDDPATMRLGFQPHLTFLECEYPVDNYVLAVRRREEPRGEASNAVAERVPRKRMRKLKLPQPEKTYLVVHRLDHSVWYKRLTPEAYRLCTALKKGVPLQAAIERAFRGKADESAGATLQGWFAQWASFSWFCRAE